MDNVKFRGHRVQDMGGWVVCILVGKRDPEWWPLIDTARRTRPKSIEAFGREDYERGRRAGDVACMMLSAIPHPHCSMGDRDGRAGRTA